MDWTTSNVVTNVPTCTYSNLSPITNMLTSNSNGTPLQGSNYLKLSVTIQRIAVFNHSLTLKRSRRRPSNKFFLKKQSKRFSTFFVLIITPKKGLSTVPSGRHDESPRRLKELSEMMNFKFSDSSNGNELRKIHETVI